MDNKIVQIYTIGYISDNRTVNINDFIECLKFYGIKSLIDIRANPMPTDYPEYDRGHLQQFCEDNTITYHWAGRQFNYLSGAKENSQHEGLADDSFRAYADYMETRQFKIAAAQIINMAQQGSLALFSKAIQPDNDSRALISDYLLLQGIQVFHVISMNDSREHLLHKNARRESMELIYDN